MNDTQKRIAIAEACGWKLRHEHGQCWGGTLNKGKFVWFDGLPDYLNDLNAMHGAEKTLSHAQWQHYMSHLNANGLPIDAEGVPDVEGYYWDRNEIQALTSATAAQRSEAFLRVIGKHIDNDMTSK